MNTAVIAVFVARDAQDERDIVGSLEMLSENNSYSLLATEIRELSSDEIQEALDAGIFEEYED